MLLSLYINTVNEMKRFT